MKQPRQLSDILNEYRSTVINANRDLDSVQESVRPGFGIVKRQAQDALPNLKAEYLTRLLKNSIVAFAIGDETKAQQFADVAVKAGGAITVDANAPYSKIASRIAPSIGRNREFSVHQAALLDQALRELALDTGYTGKFENTAIRQLRVCADQDELTDYIRELVFASNGVTPAIIAAQNTILNAALAAGFTSKVLAVTVLNAGPIDRQAIASMFTKVLEARVDEAEAIDERFARNVFEGPKKAPIAPADEQTNPQE